MAKEARIVRIPGMRGGSPTIEGTRITVTDIVRSYWMYLPEIAASYRRPPNPTQGLVVGIEALADQLRFHFQRLTAEQVRTALVYWYQHEAEIQDELDEEDIAAIHARRRYSNLT